MTAEWYRPSAQARRQHWWRRDDNEFASSSSVLLLASCIQGRKPRPESEGDALSLFHLSSTIPSFISLSLISIPRLIPFHSIIYFTHTRSQISSLILFHSFPALKLLQNKLNLVHFKRTRKRHASSLQLYGLIGRVRSWIGVKIWGRMAYRLPLQSLAGSRPLIPKFTSLTGSAIRGPAQLFFSPDMLSSHNSHHNNYDNNYYYCYNYNNNYQYCNAASVSYGPRLPYGALVSRIHLASQRTAVRLGKLHRVRYRTDYSAHHQNVIIIAPVLTQIN